MKRRSLLACGLLPALPAQARESWRLRVPSPPFHEPIEQPYNLALLRLALETLGDRLNLQRSEPLTWARQVRELQAGAADLAPLPAIDAAYQGFRLRRVDFPLRPGLLGLRLLLVRRDRTADIGRRVRDQGLDGLRQLRLGYGQDWSDAQRLRELGFRMSLGRGTEVLFEQLQQGECDYLSRGFNEVDAELAHFSRPGRELEVLPEVALHYPLEDCFYLAPTHARLQQRLGQGLLRAQRKGSWLRLLATHFATPLRRHRLLERNILRVPGYAAPPDLDPALLDAPRWLPRILAAAA